MIRDLFADNELLSSLIDTIEDSVFIIVNGRIDFVNDELCRLSGYSPEELIDRQFLDFVAPEEREKIKAYYLKRLSGADCPKKYDSVALGSSGDLIPVRVSISLIRYQGGNAEMVICRDIRKIREFEEKYREISGNFRDALERSPDGVIISDPRGKHLYVNRRFSEILGYTPEECLDLSINDITPDRYSDQYKKMNRDSLMGESAPKAYERTVLHKDGGEIPVEMRTTTTIWDGEKCALAFLTDITERRRMEQALIESDRRMKTLLKNLPGIAYRCSNDQSWTMEFLSEGCFDLTGYNSSDLENDSILSYSEVIHPDDRARIWDEVQTALESSVEFDLEYRIITKDSSVKWVRELGRCVRCDSDGRPEILEGFISDITYRKRAEQEQKILYEINRTLSSTDDLDQLYHKLHQLINQLIPAENIYIAIINSEKQAIEFPYFVDEHDPRPGPVALGDSHGLTELVLRRGESLFVSREQFQQLERDGEIRLTGTLPQEWIGVPLRASGEIIGVLALQSYSSRIRFSSNALHLLEVVSNDIANVIVQKRAQEKLENSELFNSSIIDSSIDCIKILDLAGDLRFMSRGGQSLLEIEDVNDYIGKSWIEFWKDEDREKALAAVNSAKQGSVGRFEGFSPSASGTPKWWSVQISPIFDSDGKVDRLLAVSRDITSRKELESKYLQAQKMESIGRLAGGIAHDLNNTLAVVQGYSELIMERIPSDCRSSADLREIINAVTSSSTIVNQLLAFARRQTIAPRIVDINREIHDLTRMLKSFIGENIEFSWHPSESELKVNMDPSQIGQILTNLVVNSRDAIVDNGRISIETKPVSFDENICEQNPDLNIGEYVCLSVTDDGCGMNRRVREHLFEPFFTTKDVGEGSGLGLATVYGIVRQNQGSIRVYSEEGYGTTIKIYFPQCRDEADFKEPETIRGIPEGNGETILVVEDDASILSMMERMLSSLGYSVLTAERPEDAIAFVRNNVGRIALLITDVIMPGMNGRVLSREIVSIDEDIITLFISGYTANAIVKKGVLDKDVDFLGKPFSIGQLARTVHSLLKP